MGMPFIRFNRVSLDKILLKSMCFHEKRFPWNNEWKYHHPNYKKYGHARGERFLLYNCRQRYDEEPCSFINELNDKDGRKLDRLQQSR
jgi:hypothetical protein